MIDPDCTGSMVINLNVPVPVSSTGVIKNQLVISNGGRHIHQVSEFTPPGSTTGPVPTQASADSWKVASEQGELNAVDRIAEYPVILPKGGSI